MQVKVTKRGNSLGINIHPSYLEQLKIKENDYVLYEVKGKKLIITKKEN